MKSVIGKKVPFIPRALRAGIPRETWDWQPSSKVSDITPFLFSGHVVIVCAAKELPVKTDRSRRCINPYVAVFKCYIPQREKKFRAESILVNASFIPDMVLLVYY
jgi:hypothetical protein